LRDRLSEIRAAGASLVLIGNGSPDFARAFREDLALDEEVVLLVDPALRSYRAAGMRRGYAEVLSPRLATNVWRTMRRGYRQGAVQGDPFQLGGILVIQPGGNVVYRHVSQVAGDHPPLDDVVAALAPDAPPLPPAPEPPALVRLGAAALSKVLDPTILFSFDRTGFARHALGFDAADLDRDLTGRRAIVTGANSGIGFETALALADLGAEVVLACRSEERGLAARDAIRERVGHSRVQLERLDVSSLTDVRAFAGRFANERVDILVHNAGVLPDERSETVDGFETSFATHVAGPHLLTRLLEPALDRSDDARVVWVSSGGMYTRKLDLRDPQWQRRRYDGVLAYAETKRMQVALSQRWAERIAASHAGGSGPCIVSMHPGWADTPAVASSLPRFRRVTEAILRTPAEGADTVVWLSVAPREKLEPGGFYFDRRRRSPHLLPWTRETRGEREALWRLVERTAVEGAETSA
jgi:NAD(P)-dependent dehydrogenase (short-subunit alcohol dehydrogenase family)